MARKSRKNVVMEAPMQRPIFIRTAVYVRLSVEDNGNRGNSLENQQLIIQDYLAYKPEFQVIETYIDNGLSGLNYNRPAFQQMLQEIEAGHIDCVIVKDLSRLGRNFIDTSYYIEQYFFSKRIRFIAVTDQYDTASIDQSNSGIMLPLKNMINEAYALDIAKKIKAQAHQAMLDGEFVGARAPYGYKKDPENCHKLIVDDEAAPVVRQIFQWAAACVPLNQIVRRLNEAGIPTPNCYKRDHGDAGKKYKIGTEKWQTRTVSMILKNQTYTGDLVQGKTKMIDHVQYAADPKDYIIVRDTHPAIVSREVFMIVQENRSRTAQQNAGKENVSYTPNIFKGKIFCAHCGKSLHRQRNARKNNADNYLFTCLTNSRVIKGGCEGVYITEDELTETLTAIVEKELTLALGNSLPALQEEKRYADQREQLLRQLSAKKQALGKSRKMIQGLYEDLMEETIDREQYNSLKEDCEEHVNRVSGEIAALEEQLVSLDQLYSRQCSMQENAQNLTERHTISAELVSSLFDRIEVSHDRSCHIKFSFADMLGQEETHG